MQPVGRADSIDPPGFRSEIRVVLDEGGRSIPLPDGERILWSGPRLEMLQSGLAQS